MDLRTDLPTYALEAKLLRPTGKAKSVSSMFQDICQRSDYIIPAHYPLDSIQCNYKVSLEPIKGQLSHWYTSYSLLGLRCWER